MASHIKGVFEAIKIWTEIFYRPWFWDPFMIQTRFEIWDGATTTLSDLTQNDPSVFGAAPGFVSIKHHITRNNIAYEFMCILPLHESVSIH